MLIIPLIIYFKTIKMSKYKIFIKSFSFKFKIEVDSRDTILQVKEKINESQDRKKAVESFRTSQVEFTNCQQKKEQPEDDNSSPLDQAPRGEDRDRSVTQQLDRQSPEGAVHGPGRRVMA